VAAPRWIVDAMLGRLARYLRFFGHDTVYARESDDDELRDRAREERRRLITRDRRLAERTPRSILLTTVHLSDQLAELRRAVPDAPWEVRFDRCTLCNGALRRWSPSPEEPWPAGAPPSLRDRSAEIFVCERCRHPYWEGSHTARLRRSLDRSAGPGAPR
jgi:uncharacterized protein